MSRNKIGTNPDELRLRLKRQAEQIEAGERAATVAAAADATAIAALDARVVVLEGATPTGWTDAQPRWVQYSVPYTLFTGTAATVAQAVIANLPAGTVCSHQWVEPVNAYLSATISPGFGQWRISVYKNPPIYSAGGTAKAVDVTTPDGIDQQHAAEYIVSSSASANNWYVEADSSGTDNASTLTAGTATIHLLLSVPGATTDVLPHA